MKKVLFSFLALALVSLSFLAFKNYPRLEIGQTAPATDLVMKGVDGNDYNLDALKGKSGLVVIFSCNTCPFVVGTETKEGWQGRYNRQKATAEALGYGFVLINSNEAKRSNEDSYTAMVEHAQTNEYTMEYLMDTDSKLANAFGANTTPDVFMFDADMKLIYTGSIDDNVDNHALVKVDYLNNAMEQAYKYGEVRIKKTKNLGCSIKRKAQN